MRVLTAAAGAALLLGGCAPGVEVTALPEYIAYECRGGTTLEVARSPDGRRAAVRIDGQITQLARAASAAQERFSDGKMDLFLDGERAFVEMTGVVVRGPCQSKQPLPTYFRNTPPLR